MCIHDKLDMESPSFYFFSRIYGFPAPGLENPRCPFGFDFLSYHQIPQFFSSDPPTLDFFQNSIASSFVAFCAALRNRPTDQLIDTPPSFWPPVVRLHLCVSAILGLDEKRIRNIPLVDQFSCAAGERGSMYPLGDILAVDGTQWRTHIR